MTSRQAPEESWNQVYNQSTSPSVWGEAPSHALQAALSEFKQRDCTTLLELPCGDGRNTVSLAKSVPLVVGIDTSTDALGDAHSVLNNNGVDNCILMRGDIYELPFHNNQLDCVFCFDLIGHLRNPKNALMELLRVSKTSGCVVANVFSLGDDTRGKNMKSIGDEEYIYKDDIYFKYYSRSSVESLLRDLPSQTTSLDLIKWQESPHANYRQYPHEHESWLFTLEKE